MILPVMTAIVIIFVIWINYEIHKSTKLHAEETKNFLKREKGLSLTPGKDIASINYILISSDNLPVTDVADETANSYRDLILELVGKKAINLSDYSNTDLIIQYGTANIRLLSEYDNNFTKLVSILQKWAFRLYHLRLYKEAEAVLEYGVSCNTDVCNSYLLLAELYKLGNKSEKIATLIQAVQNLTIHDKKQVLEKLSGYLNP